MRGMGDACYSDPEEGSPPARWKALVSRVHARKEGLISTQRTRMSWSLRCFRRVQVVIVCVMRPTMLARGNQHAWAGNRPNRN